MELICEEKEAYQLFFVVVANLVNQHFFLCNRKTKIKNRIDK